MLVMAKGIYEELIARALCRADEEACGLIAGEEENGDRIIKKVYGLTNAEHSPRRFSMLPEEQFAAVRDMRGRGLRLLGNWHSHPESEAYPSREDRKFADEETMSYLILSLKDRKHPVLRAFSPAKGEMSEVGIRIAKE